MLSDTVHCPECLAEYRSGVTICPDCGATLVSGPSPGAAEAELGTLEIAYKPGYTLDEVMRQNEELGDLFDQEERPYRLLLCVLPSDDASDLVEALESEGIGARLGANLTDATQVWIHGFHLPRAQALLAEFTGDPGLLDEIGDPTMEEVGASADADEKPFDSEHEAAEDAFVQVADSMKASDARSAANRLRGFGIDVRLEIGQDESSLILARASVLVPRSQLDEARRILGITT